MSKVVRTKEELIARISAHQEKIRSYGIHKLGIFGSFVKGKVKESSDIDFFVIFNPGKKNL